MDKLLEKYIEELIKIDTVNEYDACVKRLESSLREECASDIIQNVRAKSKYMVNRFSDESTKENMLKAKEKLVIYLEDIRSVESLDFFVLGHASLERYLNNFYFFLEAFRETKVHKKATLSETALQKIEINNEYDLQHFLYAVIKPLFTDARREVAEDSGVATIRSDIKIASLNTVIEAKCTGEKKSLRSLTEEIEADIVHYNVGYIYFYVYDKGKIIKDKQAFEANFNRSFGSKVVKMFVLQPVNL